MAQASPKELREAILAAIEICRPRGATDANLQTGSVITKVAEQLKAQGKQFSQQHVLTELHELFRTGYLAWGLDFPNPQAPFFHVTNRGERAVAGLARDPGNPEGYLRHLASLATINPIAQSYLNEGLECFSAGLHKAAAVMIGGAAESVILDVRQKVEDRLAQLGQVTPQGLSDWRIKVVFDALHALLSSRQSQMPRELRDEFNSYWAALMQPIRTGRNEAGHPTSVEPVTEDAVHASFLLFPELAKLSARLSDWITQSLT